MSRDRQVVLARLVNDCPIQGRRQRLQLSFSIVHPDFHEGDVVFDIVLNGPSSLLFSCHRVHHVISRRVAARSRARPGYPLARGSKQRGIRDDLFLNPERYIAPGEAARFRHPGIPWSLEEIEMVGRHDLPLCKVGNADDRTEPEVRVTLQVVDEILACEVLLRRRPVHHVLVPKVAVHIDLRRHDSLACEIDPRRPRRYLKRTLPPDGGELIVLDNEGGVLDGGAVACDQPCTFECRDARGAGPVFLFFWAGRTGRRGKQKSQYQEIRRHRYHSAHGSLQQIKVT